MPSFSQRSDQKELLDSKHIPFDDIALNMKELNTINSLLGGHAITTEGLEKMIQGCHLQYEYSILEVGCGGGDNLRVLKTWAQKRKLRVKLTGVDINNECIQFARSLKENEGIEFIHSDYRRLEGGSWDIVFSSLFCHHFNADEFISLLKWKEKVSKLGFFINDLQRHPLAFYSIKFLTSIFSRSYLVKNDAPISVLRGFREEEIIQSLEEARIGDAEIYWRWAFRWLIVRIKETK